MVPTKIISNSIQANLRGQDARFLTGFAGEDDQDFIEEDDQDVKPNGKKTCLLIVDPQNDFRETWPDGSISSFIRNYLGTSSEPLDDVFVTLTTRHPHHHTNSSSWKNNGEVLHGMHVFSPQFSKYVPNGDFVLANTDQKKFWPKHCELGTQGHAIFPELEDALGEWEKRTGRSVHYVFKDAHQALDSLSPFYSVSIDSDGRASHVVDCKTLDLFYPYDTVYIGGTGYGHALYHTIRDFVEIGGSKYVEKVTVCNEFHSRMSKWGREQSSSTETFLMVNEKRLDKFISENKLKTKR